MRGLSRPPPDIELGWAWPLAIVHSSRAVLRRTRPKIHAYGLDGVVASDALVGVDYVAVADNQQAAKAAICGGKRADKDVNADDLPNV